MSEVALWWIGTGDVDARTSRERSRARRAGLPRCRRGSTLPDSTARRRVRRHAQAAFLAPHPPVARVASRPPRRRAPDRPDGRGPLHPGPDVRLRRGAAQGPGGGRVDGAPRRRGASRRGRPARRSASGPRPSTSSGTRSGSCTAASPRCAMARSSSLRDVDAKQPDLCETCRALFLENVDEIGEPHEQEEHADPAGR